MTAASGSRWLASRCMCTLVCLRRVVRHFPLVLAANRDEFHARAAAGPTWLRERPRIFGGRDLVAGGTWLGVTEGRFVVAVTNHRNHRPPAPGRASRGELVMRLLEIGEADAAERMLRETAPGRYNECNVLFGDVDRMCVALLRDDARTQTIELAAGLCVVTNVVPGDRASDPKIARLEALLARELPSETSALVEVLGRALADHERPPLDAIPEPPRGSIFDRALLRELGALCVHAPGYGTVSSSILMFDATGTLASWDHAEGPPCRTPYRPAWVGLPEGTPPAPRPR